MGFSRQEYWSGVALPSPGKESTPLLTLWNALMVFSRKIPFRAISSYISFLLLLVFRVPLKWFNWEHWGNSWYLTLFAQSKSLMPKFIRSVFSRVCLLFLERIFCKIRIWRLSSPGGCLSHTHTHKSMERMWTVTTPKGMHVVHLSFIHLQIFIGSENALCFRKKHKVYLRLRMGMLYCLLKTVHTSYVWQTTKKDLNCELRPLPTLSGVSSRCLLILPLDFTAFRGNSLPYHII